MAKEAPLSLLIFMYVTLAKIFTQTFASPTAHKVSDLDFYISMTCKVNYNGAVGLLMFNGNILPDLVSLRFNRSKSG